MKQLTILLFSFLIYACQTPPNENKESHNFKDNISNQVLKAEFQKIIDSVGVQGSIVIYDQQQDIYYSNDFEWAKVGRLPASTFKIPNSIMALELGIILDDQTVIPWDGKPRDMEVWQQDLLFKDALRYSCVPCYQDIAMKIGVNRMDSCLNILDYGHMKIDSNTLQTFWLTGESKINQLEQIDFLKRFYNSQLPISKRTETIMKRMLVREKNANYTLSGKTGWAGSSGGNNGWFVGYVEAENQVYYFATNLSPNGEFKRDDFLNARIERTKQGLKILDIIK